MDDVKQRYDEVPYTSRAYVETDPDRMATIATLYGLRPASPAACRYLEIGCASGGNLVPMAARLPGSTFVGVDLAPVQIEAGLPMVEALGLDNLALHAMDLTRIGPSMGDFDFIGAHGVYSWVPPEVQEGLLRVVRERLAPHGVAMISVNTRPGWSLHEIVRDLMRFHGRDLDAPADRIVAAREVLRTFADAAPDGPTGRVYRDVDALLEGLPDDYLFHDFLSPLNEPLWFSEFTARAEAAGLRFLADADLPRMSPDGLPDAARDVVAGLDDPTEAGQVLDLLRNRGFRSVLLVRDDAPVDRGFDPARLRDLYAAGRVDPVGEPVPGEERVFRSVHGVEFTTDAPLVEAAMLALSELRPRAMSLPELSDAVASALGRDPTPADRDALARNLLYGYTHGLVDLSVVRVDCAVVPGERPEAWRVARRLVENGSDAVTNLRHETVHVGNFERILLPLLDGTRDRRALVAALSAAAATGGIVLRDADDAVISDPEVVAEALGQHLDARLGDFARLALLV